MSCSALLSCRFDQMFATVLEQLQPLCVAEQKFLTSFFHFQKPEKEEEEEGESAGSQVCGRVGGGAWQRHGRGGRGWRAASGALLSPRPHATLLSPRVTRKTPLTRPISTSPAKLSGSWWTSARWGEGYRASSPSSSTPFCRRSRASFSMERDWTACELPLEQCLLLALDLTLLSSPSSPSLPCHSNSLFLLTTISQRLVIAQESGAMMSELDETLKKALVCVRRLFENFTVSRNVSTVPLLVPLTPVFSSR